MPDINIDLWKYFAFPAAAITGFLLSQTALSASIGTFTGFSPYISEIIVVGSAGLVTGWLIDDVIPAYFEKVKSRHGGNNEMGDIGGDLDEGDMDFGS